jgi:tetratricopeptide (TPR) repeat protein
MTKYPFYTKIGFLIFLIIPFLSDVAYTDTLSKNKAIELFTKANEEYETATRLLSEDNEYAALEGFVQASQLYEQILVTGFKNSQIYYNLGNAYYRQGRLGYAILNYRRAQRLMPRDEDLKANLKLVKEEIKDKEKKEGVPVVIQTLLFWYFMLNVNEAIVLAASFYFVFLITMHLLILFRTPWLRKLCIAFSVCLILTTASLVIKIYPTRVGEGVVIAETCKLRYGPGEEYEIKLEVHEGTEILIEQETNGWLKAYVYIDIAQMTDTEESEGFKTGWLPSKTVGKL